MEIKRWWQFLIVMTEKEIRVKYKMTVLGFVWAFLNPVLQMLVLGFVFNFFVPVKVDNYFIFLFAGLLPWNFVSMTIMRSTTIIVNERSLIQKSKFPKEVLVLSVVLANLIHLLISEGILLLIMILMGQSRLSWLGLPLVMVPLILFVSGMSLLLAGINVRYRDINFAVQIVVPLWFYLTPVIYTLDLLPRKLTYWFILNPMSGIINLFRWFSLGLVSKLEGWDWSSLVLSIIIMAVGWYIFKRCSNYFNEWV